MKKIISYLIMSLLFFNVLFVFYYYFKIVNFLYVDLFDVNRFMNIFTINLIVLIFDIVYILLYKLLKLEQLSYFTVIMIGFFLGLVSSYLLLKNDNYEVSDYLAVISFMIINILFLSYSLYFEKNKSNVFE